MIEPERVRIRFPLSGDKENDFLLIHELLKKVNLNNSKAMNEIRVKVGRNDAMLSMIIFLILVLSAGVIGFSGYRYYIESNKTTMHERSIDI